MNNDDIRMLKDFFAGYFHEDWPAEAGSPSDVITIFLSAGRSAEELHTLSSAIRAYAEQHKDDGDLERALFEELGCYYQPSAEGVSPHAWLGSVAAMMRAAADE